MIGVHELGPFLTNQYRKVRETREGCRTIKFPTAIGMDFSKLSELLDHISHTLRRNHSNKISELKKNTVIMVMINHLLATPCFPHWKIHWNIQHRPSSTFRFTVGGDSFRLALGGEELLDFAPGNIWECSSCRYEILEDIGSNISGIIIHDFSSYIISKYIPRYHFHHYNLGDETLEISLVLWNKYHGNGPMLCGENRHVSPNSVSTLRGCSYSRC